MLALGAQNCHPQFVAFVELSHRFRELQFISGVNEFRFATLSITILKMRPSICRRTHLDVCRRSYKHFPVDLWLHMKLALAHRRRALPVQCGVVSPGGALNTVIRARPAAILRKSRSLLAFRHE
jgi:hypothetical protein